MSALDEARMLAELAKLPDPELLQASQITDPIGADAFYSGRTVVELLTAERERLHAALDEAADMLARIEWCVSTFEQTGKDTLACPVCDNSRLVGLDGNHAPGCALHTLLEKHQGRQT